MVDHSVLVDSEKPTIINDVRITPGKMIFKDAYDGKSFNKTLTITNVGKHSVTVRIFPPTSKTFKINPAKAGHTLSSGLSLVRKIKFLYTKPTAIPQASMDIYINNTCFRYELLVATSYTQISVTPKIIDFGDIDVGMVSAGKFITITNSGTKQASYSIDVGRNPLEILIQPMKGTVQPGESKKIMVEVFGVAEGEFKQEFWIKTDPLKRIHIQGHFIEHNLLVDYPLGDPNFLILAFRKTFVGVRQQRNVVIKNHSSKNAVFCVMGRTKDEKFPLKIGGQKDINYKQFHINPMEGRLHSDQKYIMGVAFEPQKPNNRRDYYLCSLTVAVKRCRIGNVTKQAYYNPDVLHSSAPLLDAISIVSLDEDSEPEQEIKSLRDTISILLYGEVEMPNVTMEPKKIYLNNLKVNEFYLVPLKILNNSKTLPLTIKYNKMACVEVEPKTIFLPPKQVVEATIKLKPSKMGDTNVDLIFDIFYPQNQHLQKIGTVPLNVFYNSQYVKNEKLLEKRKIAQFVPGITPLITHEVGYQVDDVRFNSKIEMPRQAIVDKKILAVGNDALIAFPNDRPCIMRPWRKTIPCQTLFAKLPRIVTEYDVDYDLNPKERKLRETNQTYYQNYIRSLAVKQPIEEFPNGLEDYVPTNEKLIMMQNIKMNSKCRPMLDSSNKHLHFVSLTPYEVHNVIVTPKFIQLGRLAAHTDCSNKFNIENKNDIPIHISIKALYDSISIPQDQFILPPNSQKNINFIYHSYSSGTHHIPMFVILNFFHIFDVTVLAKIVSNTVKCVTKKILISPTEKTAFLELTNPINSDVRFMIDTTYFQLESFPSSGVIPAKRNMTCAITYNAEAGYMPVKEIALVSESGAKELVEVHFDRKRAPMALSTDLLDFGEVPLNTTVSKELIIKNNSDQIIPMKIEFEESDLFPEITISPLRYLIPQRGNIAIKFSITFKEVVTFNLPVKIIFQNEFPQDVVVRGQVIYPNVNLFPNLLKIPKIPSGSVVRASFKLTNLSSVPNFVSFPLQDYHEFSIIAKSGEDVTDGVTIEPKEKIELYLEFRPQELVAYCIYLPYILNGILGPPELNRPDSLKISQYFSATQSQYKTSTDVSLKLNVIRILCAAGKKWLQFSCLKMKFYSFDNTRQEFVVTNISNDTHEITFKMNNMESFLYIPSEDNMVIVDDKVKAILAPEESCTITIEFRPVGYGTFTANVPIYVKNYSETLVFNEINLSGNNPTPKILISKKLCYFLPTCVGSKLKETVTLELVSHTCNGLVDILCGDPHIYVSCLEQERTSDRRLLNHYSVSFTPVVDCVIETKVEFSCACNANAEMEIYACGDSSMVINFMGASEITDECSTTYPFFPEKDDKSDFASVLDSIVLTIEMWLYTQGFMYQNYYKIPDDIARYPVDFESSKMTGTVKKAYKQLPLVQLLINLMDKSILTYIDNGLTPSDDLNNRTVYNYVTYRNTISFLKSQGIFVPGLKPEHLLPYAEYIHFSNNLVDKERPSMGETFPEELFYRFSKQKWLDLFFRIYKVLVLQRVADPQSTWEDEAKQRTPSQMSFVVSDKEQFEMYFKQNLEQFPTWFFCDAKLLLWVQYHYNIQRNILWPHEDFSGHRLFDCFSNLNDSVALATITAAYCPYVMDRLKNVYAHPETLEHRIHNACIVVQVWKSLKLSFDIHPVTIVMGNRIELLFLVTYLYGVLPHYYPTENVKIEAQLSESASYQLNVSNCGEEMIKYTAIFFGEGSELFQLDRHQVAIPKKSSRTIKLTYFARKVLEVKSILLLSGECSGEKYAKSMAISIIGTPNTSECQEIKITVETYETQKQKIALQSPYLQSYSAKIFMCFEEPKSYRDFHAVSSIKRNNIPREVDVIQDNCRFPEKGNTTISLDMCFVSQGLKRFYLYFCNKEIGDFCVSVSIMSVTKRHTATEFVVELPDNFHTTCTCRKSINILCPKVFVVDVPCRNPQLWQRTVSVLERSCVDSVFVKLLLGPLGSPLIFRMLKFYLERFPQGFMLPYDIFEDHAEFTISPNGTFSTQSQTLKIRDVTSEDTVPLIIHWNDSTLPDEEYIELKNTNEKETRYLKLLFPMPVPSTGSKDSTLDRLPM